MKIISFFLCLLLCFACEHGDRKLAYQSQRNLDEADLYLENFDIPKAQEYSLEAKNSLTTLTTKYPKNIDYKLLESRANLTLFLAKNAEVIEKAAIDPDSFTKLPSPEQYRDYNTLLLLSIQNLKTLLEQPQKLNYQQKASAHTLLGSIYRLQKSTAENAKKQYMMAIQINESWIRSLKKEGNKEQTISKIKNQIQNLRMSLVEVELLNKNWSDALELLQMNMGGTSLEYFKRNFKLLNNQLVEVENRIYAIKQKKSNDQENEKLLKLIQEKRKLSPTPLAELASNSTEETARIQVLIDIADTQNNLIYRMICYRHLNDNSKYQEANKILNTFYPKLGKEIDVFFDSQQK
jgi:hypothetical protein